MARPTAYDLKRELRNLYAPRASAGIHLVDVPELGYLMIDGHGDPNTSSAYADAVTTLFTTAYAIRAVAKAELGRVHVVAPLEGLWSADDLGAFIRREKDAWDWTMMIAQPPWVDEEMVAAGVERSAHKQPPALDLLRFERIAEGRCAQVLHLGSYDDEGPLLAQLHERWLPDRGLRPTGRHHEIYLSDPRRTPASRLRTILRQAVVWLRHERGV